MGPRKSPDRSGLWQTLLLTPWMLVREVFNLVGLVFNKIYRVLTILKGQNFNKNTQKKKSWFYGIRDFSKKNYGIKTHTKIFNREKINNIFELSIKFYSRKWNKKLIFKNFFEWKFFHVWYFGFLNLETHVQKKVVTSLIYEIMHIWSYIINHHKILHKKHILLNNN